MLCSSNGTDNNKLCECSNSADNVNLYITLLLCAVSGLLCMYFRQNQMYWKVRKTRIYLQVFWHFAFLLDIKYCIIVETERTRQRGHTRGIVSIKIWLVLALAYQKMLFRILNNGEWELKGQLAKDLCRKWQWYKTKQDFFLETRTFFEIRTKTLHAASDVLTQHYMTHACNTPVQWTCISSSNKIEVSKSMSVSVTVDLQLSLHQSQLYCSISPCAVNIFAFCTHIRSHKSWSDMHNLWGLMKRPPWLKTHSTGAGVHGVQREISILDTTQSMQWMLLNASRCEQGNRNDIIIIWLL